MHEKNIKRLVVKELKEQNPFWNRLTKKEKRKISNEVLKEVMKEYSFEEDLSIPLNELTGTPSVPEGIMSLKEMEEFIRKKSCQILDLDDYRRKKKYLSDPELRAIDAILDDEIITSILAPAGYTPSKRVLFPSHYLRAEILKSLTYSEWSYRKFCKKVINDLNKKEERVFMGLPLHRKVVISHGQMSQFRSQLEFYQMVNLLVYVIHLLVKHRQIPNPFKLCGVDSTDIAVPCCPVPLAKITIGNKKVRIYSELSADCGKRRKKRNKSEYFVGYRLHTLIAINPNSGQNYPLISLVAPANHHDKLFLPQLLAFASAIGLDIKVITADEGYIDVKQNEKINQDYGIKVITTPGQNVNIPQWVDETTRQVYCNELCENPMEYTGRTEKGHEFKCGGEKEGCFYSTFCPQFREVPLDSGHFGQIADCVAGVEKVRNIRKHLERVFNLAKHREGLEYLRVTKQHSVTAISTFSHITTLLLEITGTRKTSKIKEEKQKSPIAA